MEGELNSQGALALVVIVYLPCLQPGGGMMQMQHKQWLKE